MEKKKKPAIRFKGFTDSWEQRKLGNFGKASGGTSIESEFSEDGIYKVINIGSYSENSIYNDQGIRAIKSDKTSNRVLNRNDLTMILNDKTTSGNIIGRVLLIEESGIYVYNQRTERIEIDLDEYDPVFLYEMLNAPNIREKIIKQAQGNTQIYVNWTAISLLEYMIPSKEEQAKIGEYLHSISNLITLHQRKYDKLQIIKKSMLEKMFPQNGSCFPEIRFKCFTDSWEQRKLGDIADVYDGIHQTPDYTDNGIMFLSVENINTLKSEKYISEEAFIRDYKVYPEKGDILMTRIGDVGTPNVVETTEKVAFYVSLALLKPINVDSYFLCNSILSPFFQNGLKERTLVTAIPQKINKDEVGKVGLYLPTLIDEQREIGAFFQRLNNLITLHQREVEKLQNIKKSMLETMFV